MCKREKISLMVKTRILMVLKLLLNTQMTWMKMREHNPNKKHKILIVFDDLIADILSNKTLNLISTELFIRGGKLNISLLFIKQSYSAMLKSITVIIRTTLLWKFQTNKNFSKLCLRIYQILTLKTLWIIIKMYWKTIFFFGCWCYSCIREYFTFQRDSFRQNIKTSHNNW